MTIKTHEDHKRNRELQRKRSIQQNKKKKANTGKKNDDLDDDSVDIDIDDEFDEADFNLENQSLARNPCPFPSTPFSTSNRAQSAAVYIIYTYDVLNIFVFVFTGNYLSSSAYIPFIGHVGVASGILVEIIIQFLQVIMIGIKFYPILIVADAQPHIVIYFFASIYMLFIWVSWFVKKAFCSRTEAFIKQAFKKVRQLIFEFVQSLNPSLTHISNLKKRYRPSWAIVSRQASICEKTSPMVY